MGGRNANTSPKAKKKKHLTGSFGRSFLKCSSDETASYDCTSDFGPGSRSHRGGSAYGICPRGVNLRSRQCASTHKLKQWLYFLTLTY